MTKRIAIGAAVLVGLGVALGIVSWSRARGADRVVAVLLFTQHPIIDSIRNGYVEETRRLAAERGVHVDFVEKNANGKADQLPLLADFLKAGSQTVTAVIGLPAAQALKGAGFDRPVVFCGVPDPVRAGLVTSLAGHNSNFTGTAYFPPVGLILTVFGDVYPGVGRVTALGNPGEAQSAGLIKALTEAGRSRGVEVTHLPVSTASELEVALQRAVELNVPVFVPTDNYLYSNLGTVVARLRERSIPLFSVTRQAVEQGADFAVATDYHDVGVLSARLAAPILFDGRAPNTIDVLNITTGAIYVNQRSAALAEKVRAPEGYRVDVLPR